VNRRGGGVLPGDARGRDGTRQQGSTAALAWVPVSCSAAALRAGGEQGGLGALPPDDDILFVVRQTGLGGGGDLIGDVRHREAAAGGVHARPRACRACRPRVDGGAGLRGRFLAAAAALRDE